MSDGLLWHREFLRYTPPQVVRDLSSAHVGRGFSESVSRHYEREYSWGAFALSADGLKPVRIMPKPGQIFGLAATPFERDWSILCGSGGFEPVVDDSFSVVGHVGWVQDASGQIFVQQGSQNGQLRDIVDGGLPAVVARSIPDSATYAEHSGFSDISWNVLTDPDGKILLVISSRDRGGDMEPAVDPGLVLAIAGLVVAVGKGVGKYVARRVASYVAKKTAKSEFDILRATARKLLSRQPPGRAVINLAGTGEAEGAINVNPLLDQQVRDIPNLVKAKAEHIGEIFPPASADKIVSNNVVFGQVDWGPTARGCFSVLKPGGTVSIAPYAGQLASQVEVIKAALTNAGFSSIKDIGGVVVTAVK
jgi:hypothetical protein